MVSLLLSDVTRCGLIDADVSGQFIGPILKVLAVFSGCQPWKTEPVGRPKTSVNNYQSTPRDIQKQRGSNWFLGEFLKLRKMTIIFVMSARPSVRTEELGFYWTEFHEI